PRPPLPQERSLQVRSANQAPSSPTASSSARTGAHAAAAPASRTGPTLAPKSTRRARALRVERRPPLLLVLWAVSSPAPRARLLEVSFSSLPPVFDVEKLLIRSCVRVQNHRPSARPMWSS